MAQRDGVWRVLWRAGEAGRRSSENDGRAALRLQGADLRPVGMVMLLGRAAPVTAFIGHLVIGVMMCSVREMVAARGRQLRDNVLVLDT